MTNLIELSLSVLGAHCIENANVCIVVGLCVTSLGDVASVNLWEVL